MNKKGPYRRDLVQNRGWFGREDIVVWNAVGSGQLDKSPQYLHRMYGPSRLYAEAVPSPKKCLNGKLWR